MSLANGMKNLETRYSEGFCCACNKTARAIWDRIGDRLLISCEECGTVFEDDKKRFSKKKAKE